jgi:hypothetical protein
MLWLLLEGLVVFLLIGMLHPTVRLKTVGAAVKRVGLIALAILSVAFGSSALKAQTDEENFAFAVHQIGKDARIGELWGIVNSEPSIQLSSSPAHFISYFLPVGEVAKKAAHLRVSRLSHCRYQSEMALGDISPLGGNRCTVTFDLRASTTVEANGDCTDVLTGNSCSSNESEYCRCSMRMRDVDVKHAGDCQTDFSKELSILVRRAYITQFYDSVKRLNIQMCPR